MALDETYEARRKANDSIRKAIGEVSRSIRHIEDMLYIEPGSSAQMARSFEDLRQSLDRFSSATAQVSQNLTDEYRALKE